MSCAFNSLECKLTALLPAREAYLEHFPQPTHIDLNDGKGHLGIKIARYGYRVNLLMELQNQGEKPFENATAKIIKSCLLLEKFFIKKSICSYKDV